jgi:hypothetical protein
MQTVVQMSRALAAAGLRVNDMVAHCGFIWSFMFEVLAPHKHPAGRIIMITDMTGIKLGQAVGEGQVGCRTADAVCDDQVHLVDGCCAGSNSRNTIMKALSDQEGIKKAPTVHA